jgi:hypothetical protein
MARSQPYTVAVDGGLVSSTNVINLLKTPGVAKDLRNFEVSTEGGYRRINGYQKFGTTNATKPTGGTTNILGVFPYADGVIATAGTGIFFSNDGQTWLNIGRSSVASSGDDYTAFTGRSTLTRTSQGQCQFTLFDGATFDYGQVIIADGTGSIVVEDQIEGIRGFRNELFIFCTNSIFKLININDSSNIAIVPVTKNVGCLSGYSIQEIGGDLIFLAPDGLRTVAGTARIGDIELGTVSKAIQPLVTALAENINTFVIDSVVLREKSQYRLFYTDTSLEQTQQKGIIGTLRPNGFQWSETRSLEVTAIGSGFDSNNVEQYYHGDTEGFVYQHDTGNSFDGSNILARFETPNYDYGDLGTLKTLHYVRVSASSEGIVEPDLQVRFDYGNTDIPQPPNLFDIGVINPPSKFADALFNTNVFGGGDNPLIRVPLQGSGTSNNFTIISDDTKAPYTINGFYVDYIPSGRR